MCTNVRCPLGFKPLCPAKANLLLHSVYADRMRKYVGYIELIHLKKMKGWCIREGEWGACKSGSS